jgi:hypothetical protein
MDTATDINNCSLSLKVEASVNQQRRTRPNKLFCTQRNAGECRCTKHAPNSEKSYIRKHAKNYFRSENTGALNSRNENLRKNFAITAKN